MSQLEKCFKVVFTSKKDRHPNGSFKHEFFVYAASSDESIALSFKQLVETDPIHHEKYQKAKVEELLEDDMPLFDHSQSDEYIPKTNNGLLEFDDDVNLFCAALVLYGKCEEEFHSKGSWSEIYDFSKRPEENSVNIEDVSRFYMVVSIVIEVISRVPGGVSRSDLKLICCLIYNSNIELSNDVASVIDCGVSFVRDELMLPVA